MSTGNIPFSLLSKNDLVNTIEAIKIDLLENEKKIEDALKDTNRESLKLENQINTCFELRCKYEDCLERLKELELNGDYTGSSSYTLMDFVSSISNVKNDFGPEALIVVTSEVIGERYIRLIRRLELENVMILTIRALTAGDVNVTLKYVRSALWDGSEATYREFLGSKEVLLVISNNVPANRLYFVHNDSHRDECFELVSRLKPGCTTR